MHMKRRIAVLLLPVMLIFPGLALADEPPAFPLAVYGNVKIDNADAPIGTVITVFNGVNEVSRVATTQAGKYFLEVPEVNKGETLVYKVNGTEGGQKKCANPLSVASDKIDLSVTTTSSGDNGGNSGGNNGGNTGGNSGSSGSSGSSNDTNETPTPSVPAVPSAPNVPGQVLGEKTTGDKVLDDILSESGIVFNGDVAALLSHLGNKRETKREESGKKKYVANLIKGLKNILSGKENALTNFIAYGTRQTQILGEGERAGALNSFKAAFGKVPETEEEWQDALKIALGRWPNKKSSAAEKKALLEFKKIYKREANMKDAKDNAAVTVMAYGLRPAKRNMNSEATAIKSFKAIYKKNPSLAIDWDIVRAIAYSGAKR